MKKIFLLFFSLVFLTSCSNDDDGGNVGDDPILGKWFVAQVNNGSALNIEVSECNKQSFIDFKTDGFADTAFYSENDGECTIDDSESSSWKNLSGVIIPRYKFTIPFEGIGSQSGEVEFNGSSSFTFSPDILSDFNTSIVFEKR